MKNTIAEVKNSINSLNNRRKDRRISRISKLEDKTIIVAQSEQ